MSYLASVPERYHGAVVYEHIENLRKAFAAAVVAQDWKKIKHLDRICVAFIDKVIAANPGNQQLAIAVLDELKRIYASLINACHQKVASMAI